MRSRSCRTSSAPESQNANRENRSCGARNAEIAKTSAARSNASHHEDRDGAGGLSMASVLRSDTAFAYQTTGAPGLLLRAPVIISWRPFSHTGAERARREHGARVVRDGDCAEDGTSDNGAYVRK